STPAHLPSLCPYVPLLYVSVPATVVLSFPTRRSSDLHEQMRLIPPETMPTLLVRWMLHPGQRYDEARTRYQPFDRIVDERLEARSEEHTSELQSHLNLVCRLLLEKKKTEPTYNQSLRI